MEDAVSLPKTDVRTVTVRGNVYIRAEDVATLFLEFGAVEETDVRNRCTQMAQSILRK